MFQSTLQAVQNSANHCCETHSRLADPGGLLVGFLLPLGSFGEVADSR